jgi:hypothetical protein
MVFERKSLLTLESSEGYVVTAVRYGSGWLFEAHGPKRSTVFHRDGGITTGAIEHQVSYAIGEPVPTSRDSLGVFRPADHGGNDAAREAAKAACLQHRDQAALALAGPPQLRAMRASGPAGFG